MTEYKYKYSLFVYLLLVLNLQPPDDFTRKYFPAKSFYPPLHVSCLTLNT